MAIANEERGYSKTAKIEHVGDIKNGIPSPYDRDGGNEEEEEQEEEQEQVYTFQDPNFYDYTKPANFTKKTGIELDDFYSFAFKELVDNAPDFLEENYRGSSPTVMVYISNNAATGFRIAVVNPNLVNGRSIPIFSTSSLQKTFNYLGAFSSKSNQYRITRGAQGVALKQLAVLAYMQYGKNWNEPIIFQHNGRIDKVYVSVDRRRGKIIPRFEDGGKTAAGNTYTKIVLTLPVAMTKEYYKRLIEYCKIYTLPNTHIGYEFHFDDDNDDGLVISLPAQHPISKDYKNPSTIYCHNNVDFYDLLNDFAAADYRGDMTWYKAVSGFREINQKDGRFEYLKSMTLKDDLTEENSNRLFKELRASMQAMSKISDPYDTNVKSRKDALISRYLQIKSAGLDIDIERAVYVRTKDPKTKGDKVHKDSTNDTRYPYRFEVLAIPIKGEGQKTRIISSVNYSTSINNKSYFTSDHYVYQWTHRRTKDFLQAWNIEGIIRNSMAGHDIDDNQPIPNTKLKQNCVIICHLISQKIAYSNGYGKSSLILEPFCKAIPETIEEAMLKIPSKPKYTGLSIKENKTLPKIPDLVYEVLLKRWYAVQANPAILDPTSVYYDPWSLSTVFYITRDEKLLPLEAKYHISIIKEGTRRQITAMVSEICQKLPGSPKREQLGIFASPRASLYFDGTWHDVDVRDIANLAGKGTIVLFVEKRGVADQIKHLADIYGVAIVNTTGHLSEYAKDLIPAIIKEDGYVAILTDFDCAGINIAEKVIEEIIELLGEEIVNKRVKRLGLFLEDLERFIIGNNQVLQKITVEEPYPKQSKEDKQQQPASNVVSSIIEYAVNYYYYEGYERYEYIYDNFEYLTGIDRDEIITDKFCKHYYYGYESAAIKKDAKATKPIIDKAMAARDPKAARRIELDNVIKVVGANGFGEFVIDKIDEYFPEKNYNRAIKRPTDYIAERFHILPEPTRKYFLKVCDVADAAAEGTEKEIETELKSVNGKLNVNVEKAVNERLLCEAVAANPKVQELDKKHSELLILLSSSFKSEDDDDDNDARLNRLKDG